MEVIRLDRKGNIISKELIKGRLSEIVKFFESGANWWRGTIPKELAKIISLSSKGIDEEVEITYECRFEKAEVGGHYNYWFVFNKPIIDDSLNPKKFLYCKSIYKQRVLFVY
ncbi:MAG: hypothetical protein C0175_01615 [Caldisericum exile]|uniref:Uncharacterized protein n=1 Tax=Caldisericum exile TaxID=693075 RepID=A0A2J6X8J4_9BACT|nr:MAG: hypothetical protein C0175_01615 [Caldisericum exile]